MQYGAVIYDFDYTLADSSRGVVECISFALGNMGLAVPPLKHIKATIGLSLSGALGHLIGREPTQSESTAFSAHFIERADEVMADMTRLYPDVKDLVSGLSEKGIRQGIVSNKLRRRINEIVRREGIEDCFHVIVGAEDTIHHKPEPGALLKAVELIGCTKETAVYVGDHVVDAQASARAGIPFVAVLTGVTSAQSLSEYRPLAIMDSVVLLPQVLGLRELQISALA